ncbi:uncharacterized protein LOC126821069 [Patella vulgata]|uniref:uncharacterized protein LOC126821069 n=1 Tax=Patella vulgata TaxID=6465 RepID=UPI00217F9BF9|nr:uncharacterized protein LOC126821069 [Patella vulgata]
MRKLSEIEKLSLIFIIPANILYTLAALSHSWFQLPPHSFYGLWWVKFCDILRCQIIPAFFAEEPLWYHLLQSVSLIGWTSLFLSLIMIITTKVDKYLPHSLTKRNRQFSVASVCLISVFAISTSLVIFYAKLKESSPHRTPEISWSAILASVSCLCQLSASLILLQPVF